MEMDGILFPAAGDTVSGGVLKGKGFKILQQYVPQVWESVVKFISKGISKCPIHTSQHGSQHL
jgi:hypothetical protein